MVAMRDLFIVLPGIMGSVLERGDDEIWDPGPGMLKKLFRKNKWIESLALGVPEEPDNPNPIDGVRATKLVETQSVIPGFSLIDGYSEVHDALKVAFRDQLIEGNPNKPNERVDGKPSSHGVPNYYRFPYDWRRDLRSSAIRLDDLIRPALQALRDQRSPDAKVQFIAHSMGGLLARYWIDGVDLRTDTDFDGWKLTGELFSFGTPYRGSLDAVTKFVEGTAVVNFQPALVTLPGAHQLLPHYRCVLDSRTGGDRQWHYPKDLSIPGVTAELARSAHEDFHDVIRARASEHMLDRDYPQNHLVPLIGFGHDTTNSIELTDGGLKKSDEVPPHVKSVYSDGDGTVPAVSAFPFELEGDPSSLRYLNQKHGSLQADKRALAEEVLNRIRMSQAGTSGAARAPTDLQPTGAGEGLGMPGLAIDHEQLYLPGDPVALTVNARNTDVDSLTMTLTHLETRAETTARVKAGETWQGSPGAGEYKVDVIGGGLETSSGLIVLDDELAS